VSDASYIYLIAVADLDSDEATPIDIGYYSTRELAEQAMARHQDQAWVDILEIQLDVCSLEMPSVMQYAETEDVPAKTIYEASLKIIWDEAGPQKKTYECRAGKIRPGGMLITEIDQYGGHYDRVTVESEISMEHAVEVVYQARQKFIADRTGKLSYDPDWHMKDRFSV